MWGGGRVLLCGRMRYLKFLVGCGPESDSDILHLHVWFPLGHIAIVNKCAVYTEGNMKWRNSEELSSVKRKINTAFFSIQPVDVCKENLGNFIVENIAWIVQFLLDMLIYTCLQASGMSAREECSNPLLKLCATVHLQM